MDSIVKEISQLTGQSTEEVMLDFNKKVKASKLAKLNKDLMKVMTEEKPKLKKVKKISPNTIIDASKN